MKPEIFHVSSFVYCSLLFFHHSSIISYLVSLSFSNHLLSFPFFNHLSHFIILCFRAKAFHLPLQNVRKKLQPSVAASNCAVIVVVVILIFMPPFFARVSAFQICDADHFECRDGSCILQEKMCDGRHDCPDHSDEMNCGKHSTKVTATIFKYSKLLH